MTIEEAIKHYKEKAKEKRQFADYHRTHDMFHNEAQFYSNLHEKRAEEYDQLVRWLEELVVLRKAYKLACSELDKHANNPNCELEPISNRGEEAIQEFFIDEAREKLDND